ncbi:MAG: magnesium and cobalt transport protein CorA [Candidatus Rokuibacteriota bacterium]|nr:MAG: magnesium and cobalt transport protein CorA [Candidatus Rokubacteria bacterium]
MKGVVNSVAYAAGLRVGEVAIPDISEVLKEPGRFVWIGLHEPDDELLAEVQQEFALHDLAIEDAARAHQRPKLERYGDSLFVVLRTAHLEPTTGGIDFGETHLFVGSNYVVSVRHGPSMPYVEVRSRCEANPDLLAKGPVFVLYSLMDFIVDQYFPLVDAFEDRLQALEDDIFRQTLTRETTERIYQLKRALLEVKRAVAPLVDMCNRLVRADVTLIPEDARVYFRDVYDHVIRINEMIDTLRELLTTALEANLSLISVSQNEAMKRLAGWAAIIAVPTMIAGIYGMNFKFMPELDWIFGYPVAMAVMLGACGYLYYRFKRSGWL